MRSTQRLATGPGFTVDDVRFRMPTPSWTSPEAALEYRLVFVRRGVYRLRLNSRQVVVDPASVYAVQAGDEQSIAHRVSVDDAATSIMLSAALLADLTGDRRPPVGLLRTAGRFYLAHRVLVARARAGADEFELSDCLFRLTECLLDPEQCRPSPLAQDIPSATRSHIAQKAREAITEDPVSLGLRQLAAAVNVSAPYLSRIFHQETGLTLSRFRNRLRVGRAVDRLEAGERDLSRLALDLGFADHAHLTRTVRAELGHPPSVVREMLAHPRPPDCTRVMRARRC